MKTLVKTVTDDKATAEAAMAGLSSQTKNP